MGQPLALARAKRIREAMLDHGVPQCYIHVRQGRPAPGDDWNALNPIAKLSHHIVSRPTVNRPNPGLNVVINGRPGLDGPLANGYGSVDLIYRIITLGYANHSGLGGPWTVSGPLGSYTIPANNGRPYLWGTEYEGGLDENLWSDVFVNKATGKRMEYGEFMGRANAALTEAIWLPGISTHGKYQQITPGMDLSGYHGEHSTWTSRKIDRLGYTTESGRAEIRRYNKDTGTTNKDGDLDVNEETLRKIIRQETRKTVRQEVEKILAQPIDVWFPGDTDPDDRQRLGMTLNQTHGWTKAVLGLARENRDMLKGIVDSLGSVDETDGETDGGGSGN